MRLPRIIISGSVWIRLWQQERRTSNRLRRERDSWRDKFLQRVNVTPLFTPLPKSIDALPAPPIGLAAKRLRLAQQGSSAEPSAEEILEAASKVQGNGHHS